jgi:D-arabinose 1-dehydrogenase-like Zn-dependent alcohol dehydrogenase
MKAVLYESFEKPPQVVSVPDPHARADGVVIRLGASGVCRSDWHGWMGHDKDIVLPHVPGHELAGTIEAVGRNVTRWRSGDLTRNSRSRPHNCGRPAIRLATVFTISANGDVASITRARL